MAQEENPAIPVLSKWLDDHYHKSQTSDDIILVASQSGDTYKFRAAFLVFVLEGEIDVKTLVFSKGIFSVVVPIWGRITVVEDIQGHLPIVQQFFHISSIHGTFTLMMDKLTPANLVIDCDITVTFVNAIKEKIALFPIPNTLIKENALAPTLVLAQEQQLLDKFISDHGKETGRVLVATYTPPSSKEYTFTVAFSTNGRVIFQLEGAIDPTDNTLRANFYARVPLWGNVLLQSMYGKLEGPGVESHISNLVAVGSVKVFKTASHDVQIAVDFTKVKFVGKHIIDSPTLFKLPF